MRVLDPGHLYELDCLDAEVRTAPMSAGESSCGCSWDDNGAPIIVCAEHDIARRGYLLPCGCRREETEEHDLILEACDSHVLPWRDFERQVGRALDHELDVLIRDYSSRRRVKPDPEKRLIGILR